jgi:hypothetical protein
MIIPDIRKYEASDGRWWLAVVTLQPVSENYGGKPCTHWQVLDAAGEWRRGGYRYGWGGWALGFDSAQKAISRMAGTKVRKAGSKKVEA